jgi:hypothetical protein
MPGFLLGVWTFSTHDHNSLKALGTVFNGLPWAEAGHKCGCTFNARGGMGSI